MKHLKPAKPCGRGAQDDLIAMMQRHRLTLPRNAADWRVAYGPDGQPIFGDLHGIVVGKVRLLCTDGLLAWFLLGDEETVLFGHLANLVVEKQKKQPREAGQERKPSRTKKNLQLAIDFLTAAINDLQ